MIVNRREPARIRQLDGHERRARRFSALWSPLIAVKSWQPARNLVSRRQLMTGMLNEIPGVLCPLPETLLLQVRRARREPDDWLSSARLAAER